MRLELTICLTLFTLAPVASKAEIAGDWTGVLNFPQRSMHVVLHISGPDNALTATSDSPDQNIYGRTITAISFSGSTLRYSNNPVNVTFQGDLNSNGTIVGTFTQGNGSVPLVLARTEIPPHPKSTLNGPPGELKDGVYHHNASGVELTLPGGWLVGKPAPALDDPNYAVLLLDPEHRANSFLVDMRHYENLPERLPASLSLALETLVARHAGQNGAQGTPGYKIHEGSVEHTMINGMQALRAAGEFERNGMKITELVTYIFTAHTRTEFTARVPSEKVASLLPAYEQVLQSARLP